MFLKLLLLFTVIPFVELALLIKIGTIIGVTETIMLIVITGIAGAVMVRAAGINCMFRIQQNMQEGIVPTDELFNGALILVAGAFLVTPGLITDAAGFLLLVSPARDMIKKWLQKYLRRKFDQTELRIYR